MFTIEPQDCETYGYTYVNTIYSKYPTPELEADRDILFVGRAKNRLDFLHEMAQKLKRAGITYRFFIFGVKKEDQIVDSGIVYNEYIPYEKVLEYVERSKYVLELLQEGQTGITFRCYECFLYNRTLVTNNNSVPAEFKNMNIIQFKDNNDLIKSLENYRMHNYDVDDRFSPIHLLSLIQEE